MNELKLESNIGFDSIVEIAGRVIEYLEDMGVDIHNIDKMNHILELIQKMHNSQHLWVSRGWSPNDLAKQFDPTSDPKISIGPGLKRAF